MGSQIPTLGWILIILIGVIFISLNLSLFLKTKNKREEPRWISTLHVTGQTLKDPFKDENAKLQELAEMVIDLQQTAETVTSIDNGTTELGEKNETEPHG